MSKPTLWHIEVSHYSEKVRWALAHKGVDHQRKAPPPGIHMLVAAGLTRGRAKTFPVLEIDGERVGDSTAIIAALEQRYPEPALYPSDRGERERALALEEWFDEELGPPIRLLAWHELTRDDERLEAFATQVAPGPLRRFGGVAAKTASGFVNLRYGVRSEQAAEIARGRVADALDRLESELGSNTYLVGERFSVADLTAASLFYPLVLPPEAPRAISDPPEAFRAYRAPFSERRGFRWVEEMFSRHRS
jgi:glutathione S-transferase